MMLPDISLFHMFTSYSRLSFLARVITHLFTFILATSHSQSSHDRDNQAVICSHQNKTLNQELNVPFIQ